MARETFVQNILRKAVALLALLCAGTACANTELRQGHKLAIDIDADPGLSRLLVEDYAARGDNYQPRTEHLNDDGSPVYINRLIREDSPYLLQHAHNPVNWYPWGEEAFREAKRLGKPVFLSIGYATCHWCHVMERESFESEAIARIINRNFIAIKVDREQRPDVDATFMQAVMLLNGSGGWPLSSFLTPDGEPFYGGTYFPPEKFAFLLNRIVELWREQREALVQQAGRLSAAVVDNTQLQGEVKTVGAREYDRAIALVLQRHDDFLGGFGQAPKFPQESLLYLLLEDARRNSHQPSLKAADFSLQQMARGGIHDQIAGGFHRYSVDNEWLVPHFEKMLYNQAALARNYLAAFQLTGDAQHARTARRIVDYVLREMTSPEGGFYSATDADSEGEEGTYFVWTPDELEAALSERDATLAIALWGVTDGGNFEGSNILYLRDSIEQFAGRHPLDARAMQDDVDRISKQLLEVRNRREPPIRDDKILTEWNGMTITALAEASRVLNNPAYLEAASRSASWLWKTNRRSSGNYWRAHFEGHSSIEATQADLAWLAEAMLALYDASADEKWLGHARELIDAMIDQFWDRKRGGFFMGGKVVGGTELLTRPKDLHDGAVPSGNGVAMRVLVRLWHRTGEERYLSYANKLLSAFSGLISQRADAFSYMLVGASDLLWGESGSLQYAARGRVRVDAMVTAHNEVRVAVAIAPGWHLNAHQPLQDYLIGTQLASVDAGLIEDVVYPQPVSRKLGFQRETLSLYEENIIIRATLSARAGAELAPLKLRLQACNDEVCLAPETLALNLSLASE